MSTCSVTELLTCPSQALRYSIYVAAYWADSVGLRTGDQLAGLTKLVDDVAESESAKAEQRGSGMGQKDWFPNLAANHSEAGPSNIYDAEGL